MDGWKEWRGKDRGRKRGEKGLCSRALAHLRASAQVIPLVSVPEAPSSWNSFWCRNKQGTSAMPSQKAVTIFTAPYISPEDVRGLELGVVRKMLLLVLERSGLKSQ